MKGRDTVSLEDVEILRVGVWNGVPVTRRYLEDLAAQFAEASKHLRPTVRLGHDARQAFARALFGDETAAGDPKGWPALGFVEGVEVRGESLFATFANVPAKLAEWVKAGRWPTRSAGIWPQGRMLGGKMFDAVLDHVALLGSDTPAVDGLEAIGLSADDDGDSRPVVVRFSAGESGGDDQTDLDRLLAGLRGLLDEHSPLIFGRSGAPRVRAAFGLFSDELRRVARASMPQGANMSTVVKVAELLKLSKDAEPAAIVAGLRSADSKVLGELVQFMEGGGASFDTPEQLVGYLAGMLGVSPGDLSGIAAKIAELTGAGPADPASGGDPAADPSANMSAEGGGVNMSTDQRLAAEVVTMSARIAELEQRERVAEARQRVARDQADRGLTLPAPAVDVLVELAAAGNDAAYRAVLENSRSVPTGERGTGSGADAAAEPSSLELSIAKTLGYAVEDLREFKAAAGAGSDA